MNSGTPAVGVLRIHASKVPSCAEDRVHAPITRLASLDSSTDFRRLVFRAVNRFVGHGTAFECIQSHFIFKQNLFWGESMPLRCENTGFVQKKVNRE